MRLQNKLKIGSKRKVTVIYTINISPKNPIIASLRNEKNQKNFIIVNYLALLYPAIYSIAIGLLKSTTKISSAITNLFRTNNRFIFGTFFTSTMVFFVATFPSFWISFYIASWSILAFQYIFFVRSLRSTNWNYKWTIS